jgi:hypothetical protein
MLAQRVGRCDCVCMPRIIVTGGRGGLATALARHFRALGAEVHRPGREDLDVRRVESVEAYFSAFDQLDVLVNNAGITGDNLMAKLSPQGWDEVIDTNLKGAYLCSRAAARLMGPRRRGHIIQIGSFSALHPSPGQAAYAASKAALIGLTKGTGAGQYPGQLRAAGLSGNADDARPAGGGPRGGPSEALPGALQHSGRIGALHRPAQRFRAHLRAGVPIGFARLKDSIR